MGVTETLANFALNPPANFLTSTLLHSVKERFLDTVGIMVAGADSAASRIVIVLLAASCAANISERFRTWKSFSW